MEKINRQVLLAVVWLILAGGMVRVWGWSDYFFSPDDVMHLHMADQPGLAQVWESGMAQFHPPLLYLVYHAALKVSRDPSWLRSVSLAPALATMIALFFLGRKFVGDLAGLVAAGLFALSYGNILVDQVVRHYSLLLLFLTLALWFFLSYIRKPREWHLMGLSVCGVLAVMTHYSGVIFLAGLGMAWLGAIAVRRRPRAEYFKPVAAFLPAVLALAYLYSVHVSDLFASGFYGRMQEDYLKVHYASTILGFGQNLLAMFGYLFLPPLSASLSVMILFGLLVLFKRGPRVLAAATVVSLLVHVALNLLHKYPLGGGRQGLYFSPFAALAVGAGVQWAWEWLSGRESLGGRLPAGFTARVRGQERKLAVAALVGVFILPLTLWPWLTKNDFLRRYQEPSWMEFPLTTKSMREVFEIIQRERMPGDVVLTNGQTSHYLFFLTGEKGESLGDGLVRIEYQGLDYYFIQPSWTYEHEEQFMVAFRKLRTHVPPERMIRVWLLNLGWGLGFPEKMDRIEKHGSDGANLFLLEWQQVAILRELGR